MLLLFMGVPMKDETERAAAAVSACLGDLLAPSKCMAFRPAQKLISKRDQSHPSRL